MIDIVVPAEQEGTKATVRNWLKKVGDTVAVNDPLVELETDKVTMEVSAPAAGILAEIVLASDTEAEPGALLGRLSVANAPVLATSAPDEAKPLMAALRVDVAPPTELRLSPAVRRAAAEHQIDPLSVRGTGRDGRVTKADIDSAVMVRGATEPQVHAQLVGVTPALKDVDAASRSSLPGSRDVPHDRMRRSIAQNVLNSVTVAPHVTAVFEADFSAIMAHRRKHKAVFEKQGVSLTFTTYFVAASVIAMRVAPAINSRWHEDRLEIFNDVNVGVGTALGDNGLVVPVIHYAQTLSLLGIASRLQDITTRARCSKLDVGDTKGGTFTISNHGISGSLFASPIIINQPESAILGIGKLEKRVVVREVGGVDTIQIRPLSYVSLTIDHRVVDGHQTNGWLSSFVQTLEQWPLDD